MQLQHLYFFRYALALFVFPILECTQSESVEIIAFSPICLFRSLPPFLHVFSAYRVEGHLDESKLRNCDNDDDNDDEPHQQDDHHDPEWSSGS